MIQKRATWKTRGLLNKIKTFPPAENRDGNMKERERFGHEKRTTKVRERMRERPKAEDKIKDLVQWSIRL